MAASGTRPAELPLSHLDWVRERIESSRLKYESTNDRSVILDCIYFCGFEGIPLPDWLCTALTDALRDYQSGEREDLGAAFDMTRPKHWNQGAHRRAWYLKIDVFGRIDDLHRADESIGEELFEKVGKEFNISGSTARNYYYDIVSSKNSKKLL